MSNHSEQTTIASEPKLSNPSTPVDRTQAVEALFTVAQSDLRNAIFDVAPSLLAWDADSILEVLLSRALSSYDGPLEEGVFNLWAEEQAGSIALQFTQALAILQEQSHIIRAAINRALLSFAADSAVDEDDLYSEISALIFRYAGSLSRKGTAKLSTRLTALVRRHCWQHIKKRKRRFEIVQKHFQELDSAGIEVLSEVELTSMRFDALESSGPYARTETIGQKSVSRS